MAQIAYVDWDGLVYYDGKIKQHIADKLEGCLKDGGLLNFADLPSPGYDNLNYVYHINDAFISDDRFAVKGLSYDARVSVKVSETSPGIYQFTILNENISEVDQEALSDITSRIKALEDANYVDDSKLEEQLASFASKEDLAGEVEARTAAITALQENIDAGSEAIDGLNSAIDTLRSDSEASYATKEELSNAIESIEHPVVDLSGYTTREEVDSKLAPINTSITYINENVTNLTNAVNKLDADVDTVHEELHDLETEITKADFASKEYVAVKIAEAKLEASDVDLSAYYTKTEVDAKVAPLATAVEVSGLESKVNDLSTAVADVSDRALEHEQSITTLVTDVTDLKLNSATKSELEAVQNTAGQNSVKLFQLDSDLVDINAKLDTIPTKTSDLVNDSNFLTEHQDLSEYAKKTEIPSIEGLATEEFVNKKIAEAELGDKDIDLEAYYTKSEVDALIPEVPTKVSELENDAGYITAEDIPETDLSNYYNKTETENLIAEAVESIEHPTIDLEGYATEEWVNEQGFLKEHQDLSEYAKKSDIPEAELFVVDFNTPDFAAAVEAYNNGKLLLLVNAAPDANGYAVMNYVRADLITFTKFLTSRSEAYGSFNTYYLHSDNTWEVSKEVILNKVEANVEGDIKCELKTIRIGKELYSIPAGGTDINLDNYYTKDEVDGLIPDVSNFITEIPNEYITEDELAEALKDIEHPSVDLDGYATEQWVKDQNYLTQHQDLSDYAKKSEIPTDYLVEADLADYAKTSDIPTDYLTQDDLNGYSKFSGSYNDLTDKPEIPDITGKLDTSIYNQDKETFALKSDIPTDYVTTDDLSGYATSADIPTKTSQLDNDSDFITSADLPTDYITKAELDAKANNVLFNEDKLVVNAIGGFKVNDSLKGLTLVEILTTLLCVPAESPDEPDTPDEPIVPGESIVEDIKTNKLPAYIIDDNGNLVESPYQLITMTPNEAAAEPTQSGFYEIRDNGVVTETGYQQILSGNLDMYMMIALPTGVDINSNVTLMRYDELNSRWIPENDMNFTSDIDTITAACNDADVAVPTVAEGYVLWAELDYGNDGSMFRFIINE